MISISPKYNVIKQMPYCCVPACLLMILNRRKINHNLTQEEIGYDLGLAVPEKFKEIFPKAQNIKPFAGYGTQIQKEKFSVANFFKKRNINLKFEYFYVEEVENTSEFIKNNLLQNNDLMICFNYQILYKGGNDGGHLSIIESI